MLERDVRHFRTVASQLIHLDHPLKTRKLTPLLGHQVLVATHRAVEVGLRSDALIQLLLAYHYN